MPNLLSRDFIKLLLVLLGAMSACPFLHAQETGKRTYQVRSRIYVEFTQLDANGEVVRRTDSVSLQSNQPEAERGIVEMTSGKVVLPSSVRFGEGEESNRLFVNPRHVYAAQSNSYPDEEAVYYYELRNRQSIKLKFSEFTIKALSVPLKVRFGTDDLDFSTDANLGAFAGYSWGYTKFTHRKKIGNAETERKRTFGLLVGTENLEFDFENEDGERIEEQSALISTGVGFIYSYEKFALGLTAGYDFALGENRTQWAYHARPWLGIAIGYSLFSF